jgi:hypothetical protein
MRRYRLKHGGRRKVAFGESLAAAAIQAAAFTAGAAQQARAAQQAAAQQATEIRNQAQQQATALERQSENDRQLQEQNIKFMRQQNEENRQLMRDQQMQLQMLAGYNNVADRNRDTRIVVKRGGVIPSSLLRGVNSPMPFTVTDGGYVNYLGTTPYGQSLYELHGNTHNQYHKTKSGKYKSGVGIKFADGQVVEGEGSGGKGLGELLMVGPDGASFISRHSIKGFNPAQAVMQGADPNEVMAMQEMIKSMYNLSNDGRTGRPPVEERIYQPHRRLARNGLYRPRAYNGWYNIGGAGINTLGNLAGAWLTTRGNSSAAKRMSSAYIDAGNMMADAYGKLQTVDMSGLNRGMFRASSSATPAIRTADVTLNPELVAIERDKNRRLASSSRNTLSSAADNNRTNRIMTDAYDNRTQIYNRANQINQSISNENANRITQANATNLQADIEGNRAYANAYMNMLQYNNDIVNQRTLGAAGARSDAALQAANAMANARQTNGASWGSAVAASANSWANALNTIGLERTKENAAYANGDIATRVSTAIANGDTTRMRRMYDVYSQTPGMETYASQLARALGINYKPTYNQQAYNAMFNSIAPIGFVRPLVKLGGRYKLRTI